MSTNKTAFEMAQETLNSATATAADKIFAEFIIEADGKVGAEIDSAAELVNARSKRAAIRALGTGKDFNFRALMLGAEYLIVDPHAGEDPVKKRTVKAADIFCIKKNEKSAKMPLDNLSFALLEAFGCNLSAEFAASRTDAVGGLKVYAKYIGAPEEFFSETAASVTSLEKQFQFICNTLFGEDFVKIKKKYVRHASDSFTKVCAAGYRNGNAIRLLQVVLDHAQDAKYSRDYAIKSSLASHKAPKEKTAKK